MNNQIIIKSILITILTSAVLISCKKENMDKTETIVPTTSNAIKIEGEWEAYKRESQQLILGEWVNNQWTHTMEWRDLTSPNAEDNTMKFFSDKTFDNFYAGVLVREGMWDTVPSNPDEFTFVFNSFPWSALQDVYTVRFHCDNTMSILYQVEPPAGNHEFQDADWYEVSYFKRPGTDPCDDQIEYYVQ